MSRRRALMTAGFKWDFEWNYTDGKLEDVSGVSVDSNGGSSSIVSTGERFTVPTGGTYYQVYFPAGGALEFLRTFTSGIGIIELVFVGHLSSITTSTNLRITAVKDTSSRIVIFPSYNKFKVYDNSSIANCTSIGDYSNDVEYTVKIVFKGNTSDVYVNGNLIGQDLSNSDSITGTSTCLMFQNIGTGYYIDLKSLKIKV